MNKSYWLVTSTVFLIVMVIAIIINEQQLASTSLIGCMICHAVVDLRNKN